MNESVEYPHLPSNPFAPPDARHDEDPLRHSIYIAIAIAAFIAGVILGHFLEPEPNNSRHPTPVQPHPRSLQP
jgi:hypothetical protein